MIKGQRRWTDRVRDSTSKFERYSKCGNCSYLTLRDHKYSVDDSLCGECGEDGGRNSHIVAAIFTQSEEVWRKFFGWRWWGRTGAFRLLYVGRDGKIFHTGEREWQHYGHGLG